jgi:hypothetical protein
LDPLYGEDIEELFIEQKKTMLKSVKTIPKKTVVQMELEEEYINTRRTFETIDRLLGEEEERSRSSLMSFDGLDSQIDYKFMNSIIYQ